MRLDRELCAMPKQYRALTRMRGRLMRSERTYRVREHLTGAEMDKLLAALKCNRWLIGLLIYRHGFAGLGSLRSSL
jgi:hypothetical protein